MDAQILLPPAILREMNKTFKTGRNELNRALSFKRNSERAGMLRVAALQRGGVVFTGRPTPLEVLQEIDKQNSNN